MDLLSLPQVLMLRMLSIEGQAGRRAHRGFRMVISRVMAATIMNLMLFTALSSSRV